MHPMRHYPHVIVRIFPDYLRAALLVIIHVTAAAAMTLLPLSAVASVTAMICIALPGLAKALHAMQLSGPWSVREIVLTGGGRWFLVDSRMHKERAVIINHGDIHSDRMRFRFRDVQGRDRTVLLTSCNSREEQRRQLAVRISSGVKHLHAADERREPWQE